MSADYIVLMAAYNEEALIGNVLDSLLCQERPPCKVLVISDGSTDGTNDIEKKFEASWPPLELVCRPRHDARSFASKVHALNDGFTRVRDRSFEYVAILDADVQFGPEYFKTLLAHFDENPGLGLAAGTLCEWQGRVAVPVTSNREWSVCGPIQTFRRACFEDIGGYKPARSGEDAIAEVMSRQAGWKVKTLPDLQVLHLRPFGAAAYSGRCRAWWSSGVEAYELGYDPVFFFARCIARSIRRPVLIGACAALAGFLVACLVRPKRVVPPEFIRSLRQEQRGRMRSAMGWGGTTRDPGSPGETSP